MTQPVRDRLQNSLNAFAAGEFRLALKICQTVLADDPNNIDGLHLMGMITLRLGRARESAEWSSKALAKSPRSHFALNNRAAAWLLLPGAWEMAIADATAALTLQPGLVDARLNRGLALLQAKRPLDARIDFEAFLKERPLSPDGLAARANARRLSGDMAGAKLDAQSALSIGPQHLEALYAVGAIFQDERNFGAAVPYFDRVLLKDPTHFNALAGRVIARAMLKDHPGVLEDVARAQNLAPELSDMEEIELHSRMSLCDWSRFDDAVARLHQRVARGQRITMSFNALSLFDDPADLLAAMKLIPAPDGLSPDRSPAPPARPIEGRPIRVAYVSADFREHPVARMAAEFIEAHDRRSITPIAVALTPADGSAEGDRVRTAFAQVIQVTLENDLEIAETIRRHEIDVVVDLMGHTSLSRPGIFANRAAPVQVGFLGFPGSTASPWTDYLIADNIVIPPGEERHYTETICRMPDCYHPTSSARPETAPHGRQAFGLPESGTVFACFSNTWKITPKVFSVWMELLKAVPGSVLWLRTENKTTEKNLRREAKLRDVAPARLVFAHRSSHDVHLARHVLADIMLDTAYYGAHTTTCDALLMGVPMITVHGSTFPSRTPASMLIANNCSELVVDSLENYFALARDLALDKARLLKLRDMLERRRVGSAYFDMKRFSQHFVLALRHMAGLAAKGASPEPFSVSQLPA